MNITENEYRNNLLFYTTLKDLLKCQLNEKKLMTLEETIEQNSNLSCKKMKQLLSTGIVKENTKVYDDLMILLNLANNDNYIMWKDLLLVSIELLLTKDLILEESTSYARIKYKEIFRWYKKKNKFPIFPKELDGTSVKSKLGFKFIKEAKYHNTNLESAVYKEMFTQSYQTTEKLKQINTKEEFIKAVTGATNYEVIEEKLSANVEKFITEYTKEETRIKDENGTDEIGTTPGEIALTFYKLSLSNELVSDVILIDQPEDDISMKRIENYMIDYFNSIRDKKQIIFVTHNPLLVVNLDVDNVINVSKDRKNMISIQSGCIESSNMIDLLAYENPVFYTGF